MVLTAVFSLETEKHISTRINSAVALTNLPKQYAYRHRTYLTTWLYSSTPSQLGQVSSRGSFYIPPVSQFPILPFAPERTEIPKLLQLCELVHRSHPIQLSQLK